MNSDTRLVAVQPARAAGKIAIPQISKQGKQQTARKRLAFPYRPSLCDAACVIAGRAASRADRVGICDDGCLSISGSFSVRSTLRTIIPVATSAMPEAINAIIRPNLDCP